MQILVVDDKQLVRWFLDRALRKDGHEVITAENVQDASAKLSSVIHATNKSHGVFASALRNKHEKRWGRGLS